MALTTGEAGFFTSVLLISDTVTGVFKVISEIKSAENQVEQSKINVESSRDAGLEVPSLN